MTEPNFILLYVADPASSAAFYGELLGGAPVEASPTFALFRLGSGVMLGLWARRGVEPAATGTGASSELAFAVGGDAEVDALHERWCGRGLDVAQPPTRMDFGYTFVALDPDGHRLRVFAPGGA